MRKREKETGLIVIERSKVREKGTDKARERKKVSVWCSRDRERERVMQTTE